MVPELMVGNKAKENSLSQTEWSMKASSTRENSTAKELYIIQTE